MTYLQSLTSPAHLFSTFYSHSLSSYGANYTSKQTLFLLFKSMKHCLLECALNGKPNSREGQWRACQDVLASHPWPSLPLTLQVIRFICRDQYLISSCGNLVVTVCQQHLLLTIVQVFSLYKNRFILSCSVLSYK